jgi:phage shock protein PspC (stress-responsive transcriptional regulator)
MAGLDPRFHLEPSGASPLARDRDRGIVAGVCAGMARRFGRNAWWFRGGFVVLAFLAATGVVLYAAFAVLLPADEVAAARPAEEAEDRVALLVGGAVLLLAVVALVYVLGT